MKLVTYVQREGDPTPRLGVYQPDHSGTGGQVVDVQAGWAGPDPAPATMQELLTRGEAALAAVRAIAEGGDSPAQPLAAVRLLAPLPRPNTVRDFYAFEQHVKTARALRGADMIPEWYQIPVFYFTNPEAILGPDAPLEMPHTEALDFELELACVIGQAGRDIAAEDAERYIAGYTIMNDWSARDVQMLEMKMNLGPAKGKDFATSLGPWLVTPDELAPYRQGSGADTRYALEMTCTVNGRQYSLGHSESITHTFAQMIAWASRDVWLKPGDVLGSGTVGTGCILELRPETVGGWLKPGDQVAMAITGLGTLSNPVVARGSH